MAAAPWAATPAGALVVALVLVPFGRDFLCRGFGPAPVGLADPPPEEASKAAHCCRVIPEERLAAAGGAGAGGTGAVGLATPWKPRPVIMLRAHALRFSADLGMGSQTPSLPAGPWQQGPPRVAAKGGSWPPPRLPPWHLRPPPAAEAPGPVLSPWPRIGPGRSPVQ